MVPETPSTTDMDGRPWTELPLDEELAASTKLLTELGLEALARFAALQEESCEGKPNWFRGHASVDWKLEPKAYRPTRVLDGTTRPLTNEEALGFERGQFGDFYRHAPARGVGQRLGESEYPLWLSLMQHYGLATRLLDWTESILTAAYFAVSNESRWEEDGVIYSLSPSRLNKFSCGNEDHGSDGDPYTLKVLAGALGGDPRFNKVPMPRGPVSYRPRQIDLRMMVQQSVFTVHHPEVRALDLLPVASSVLNRIVIPAGEKPQMMARLRLVGVNRTTVFPDLENLGAHLSSARFVP